MYVVINEPARLLDLANFLRRFGIVSRPAGPDRIEVTVAHDLGAAHDAGADRLEVVRALRDFCAWNPGLRAEIKA